MEEAYAELADFLSRNNPNADKDSIRMGLLNDPKKLESGIARLHAEKNSDWDYQEFKTAYIEQYGPKKKSGGTEYFTENQEVAKNAGAKSDQKPDLSYSWNEPNRKKEPPSAGDALVSQTTGSKFNEKPKAERDQLLAESSKLNEEAKKAKEILNNRVLYDQLKEKRKGNYAQTGDEIATPNQYTQDRNKRKTIAEWALWNKQNLSEGKTLAEYEYNIGNIQEDINELTGAIPHAVSLIEAKYGASVWDEIKKKSEILKSIPEGVNLSPEEQGKYNQTRSELQAFQDDPNVIEYFEMVDLYEKDVAKAKDYLKQDGYKPVADLIDHYQKMQMNEEAASMMPETVGPSGRSFQFLMKMVGKGISKIGASAGAMLDAGEAMITGDKEYTWFDEFANDFLMDFPKDVERTFPTPSRWARPLKTDVVKKDGLEYDIRDGKIQAVRNSEGTEVPSMLSEEQQQEILNTTPIPQWNLEGLTYKLTQLGVDLAIQTVITKGVGTTLGGSNLAYQTGVVASTMGQMYGDLYSSGLEMFKGDKKKAGLYAALTSAGIGVVSNASGLEAKLAGAKTKVFGESLMKGIKSPVLKTAGKAFGAGVGEAFEETFLERWVDTGVRTILGVPQDDINWNDMAETALLSFAVGALTEGAASLNPELNEVDNNAILKLVEDPQKSREFIEEGQKRKKGLEGTNETDPDAERLINRIDKTAGKMNAVEVPENTNPADVAGALFEHTVAEENLEKAKASKINPLIEAKQAEMDKADLKVAEVLDLKMDNPLLKEGEKVKVPPMKRDNKKKKPFEPITKEDHIAQWFRKGGRIGVDDYVQNADKNDLTNADGNIIPGFFKTVLTKNKGTNNLDTLAQTMSDELGTEVTVDDITEFIKTNSPKKHIETTRNLRNKANAYNMSESDFEAYDNERSKMLDTYVGQVEATPEALDVVGDILMDNNKDGKVDMGQVEAQMNETQLEPEPKKILIDAINKAKDEALSYDQAANTEENKEVQTEQKPVDTTDQSITKVEEPKPKKIKKPKKAKDDTSNSKKVNIETNKPINEDNSEIVELGFGTMGKVEKTKFKRIVKKVFDNLFKGHGQLPKFIYNLNIVRQSRINAAMKQASWTSIDLQRSINKHLKTVNAAIDQKNKGLSKEDQVPRQKELSPADMKLLGDMLKSKEMIEDGGTFSDGTVIPPEILDNLAQMRTDITALSELIRDSGIAGDELAAIIDERLNTYVHRSYRVHTDPDWVDTVQHLEQFQAARRWALETASKKLDKAEQKITEIQGKLQTVKDKLDDLKNQSSSDPAEQAKIDEKITARENEITKLEASQRYNEDIIPAATAILNDPDAYLIGRLKDQKSNNLGNTSKSGKLASKNLGILQKRKTDEQLPEAIRELYGEYKDPVTTYMHSVFKMVHLLENHKMLEAVRDQGMGKVFFENSTGEYNDEIAGMNDHFMSPLSGLRTTTEIKEAMQTFDKPMQSGPFMKGFVYAASRVKYGKTILSPATQMRNFLQNGWFHIQNGLTLHMFNLKAGKKALNVAWAGMDNLAKGDEEARAEYKKMIELGIFHEASTMIEMQQTLSDFKDQPGVYNPDDAFVKRGRKKIGSIAENLYGFGDESHKYFAYLLERQRYAQALKKSDYDKLSDADKAEIDNHVADIIRRTYQTYSTIPPYMKELRKWPITRSFISFTYELYRNTANNLIIGQEEFFKGIKTNNPRLSLIGSSRIAGTLSIYSGFVALAKGLQSQMDIDDEEDLKWILPDWDENTLMIPLKRDGNTIYAISTASAMPQGQMYSVIESAFDSRKGADDRFKEMMNESVGSVFGWDMLAQVLIEADQRETFSGKTISVEGEPLDNAKRFGHILSVMEPGGITSGKRLGKAFLNPERDYDTLNPWVEVAAVVPGIRVMSIDIEKSMYFPIKKLAKRRNDAKSLYSTKEKLNKYKKMPLKERNEALAPYKEEARITYARMWKDAAGFVQAMKRLGIKREVIAESLKKSRGFSPAEISALLNNREFNPFK